MITYCQRYIYKQKLKMSNVLRPDEDWQSRRTVIECNRYMWTNQVACDVTFIVGRAKTRIGAHKYVLASRSCVFFAMFFGPSRVNTGSDIKLDDMTPEQVNNLMQYLYTEDVQVNLNNVLQTLDASRKYGVQGLIDKCLNCLKRHMVPENVCTIMENAHMLPDRELKEKCLKLVLTSPESVFRADDLSELCQECFAVIIKDDTLAVTEEVIFQAVLKYANDKCNRLAVEHTPENLREMVKEVIPHVRFPLMDKEFVCETVDLSNLLTDRQVIELLKYFIRKRVGSDMKFSTKKRKMLFIALRFPEVQSGWKYKRDKCDAITFVTSIDILMKGIQVYGSCQGPASLDLFVQVKQEPYRTNLLTQHAVLETDGKEKVYNFFFQNPAAIKKDKKYTVTLVIQGPSTYFGTAGVHELLQNNMTVKFEKSDLSTNNTTEERGQIPSIIYELVPEPTGAEAMDVQQ